ncbi:MAG: hypothetical protein COA79_10240 [Planctomycetota bacterium]|nr:MAG: hypothetical protein COA79_10240 [Planctomycetota bacterium]
MKYNFYFFIFCIFFNLQTFSEDFPRTVKVSVSQTIILNKKPERIFVGYVGALEILMELVNKENIIAAPKFSTNKGYSNCVEYAKSLPYLYKNLSVELVEKKNPDLLILASFNDPKFLALLKKFKRKYIIIDSFNSYEDIKKTILLFGEILGEENNAKTVVLKMETDLSKIKSRHPSKKINVMSYGYNRFSAGLNTIFNDMVEFAGANNITAKNGLKGHKSIGHEKLLKLNPDVLIFFSNSVETKKKYLEEYGSKPVFKMINAIKNKKIILLNPAYGSATSQFFVKGVESLHHQLYSK